MADCTTTSSSSSSKAEKNKNKTSSSPSLFGSPRLFTNLTSKGLQHETESGTMMSPTSILDSKPSFSGFKNPFRSEASSPRTPGSEHKRYWDKLDSKGVGLGLVDALMDEKNGEFASKQENRTVLFGSQLRIQIPTPAKAMLNSPQLGSSASSQRVVFKGCLSATEFELMESSEDYTRVISRGPNPRTTHIFRNCIIQSVASPQIAHSEPHTLYPSHTFLSFCSYCTKNLGQGQDIYMFRGEKAFCSNECRYQGMLLEEGMNKLEADEVHETSVSLL